MHYLHMTCVPQIQATRQFAFEIPDAVIAAAARCTPSNYGQQKAEGWRCVLRNARLRAGWTAGMSTCLRLKTSIGMKTPVGTVIASAARGSPFMDSIAAANASRTIGFRRSGAMRRRKGAVVVGAAAGTVAWGSVAVVSGAGFTVAALPVRGSPKRSVPGAIVPSPGGAFVLLGSVFAEFGVCCADAGAGLAVGAALIFDTSGVEIGVTVCP